MTTPRPPTFRRDARLLVRVRTSFELVVLDAVVVDAWTSPCAHFRWGNGEGSAGHKSVKWGF